jgi:hypothetical protein
MTYPESQSLLARTFFCKDQTRAYVSQVYGPVEYVQGYVRDESILVNRLLVLAFRHFCPHFLDVLENLA